MTAYICRIAHKYLQAAMLNPTEVSVLAYPTWRIRNFAKAHAFLLCIFTFITSCLLLLFQHPFALFKTAEIPMLCYHSIYLFIFRPLLVYIQLDMYVNMYASVYAYITFLINSILFVFVVVARGFLMFFAIFCK